MKDYEYAKQYIIELEERYCYYITKGDTNHANYILQQIQEVEDYYYND